MYISKTGYRVLGGKRYEHVVVAEKALGRHLPKGAVVHHVNEDKLDNRPENLVILQSQAEHKLVHAKLRIADRGGNWKVQAMCGSCDTLKYHFNFPRCASRWNGYFDSCKECSNARRRGKGYGKWNETKLLQQRARRAKAKELLA